MMNTIKPLFTFLFILSFVNCFGQFAFNVQPVSTLKGKIDSIVTTTLYRYNSGLRDTTKLVERLTNIYNKRKQLIESNNCSYIQPQHSGIDARPVKTLYIYDNNGNLIESNRYFTTGELWVKDTFFKNGSMVVAREYFCPNNQLTNTDTLKIDFFGRIKERDTYVRGVGLFTKSYFKYDEKGRLIVEDTFRGDGSLMFKHTCIYNVDGDIVEDNNPFGDREVHTYKYEKYDKMNNWLKQTEYVNHQSRVIQERVIAYY